uniref:Uncharacterized protein n=1 Tax=Panagrolaimus sp. JU765 TaxID=591449 RepID=A0AC34RT30_9BILA
EWESVDNLWVEQKEKLGLGQKGAKPLEGSLADQFEAVAHWLRHAQSQLAHGTDSTVVPKLIQEARQQKENVRRLQAQAQAQQADPLVVRARELTNAIDALLKQLEERSQLGNRIKTFLQSADAMLHQLDKMETDLSDASAAIAGELGPLARQKAMAVIEEGQNILKNGHNEQVVSALSQLQRRLQEIENLAQHRIYVGNQLLKTQIANMTSWLKDTAEPFLTSNGNLGNDFASANDFVNRHKQFATDVVVSL